MILVTGADGLVGRAVSERLRGTNLAFLPLVRERSSRSLPQAVAVDLAREGALEDLIQGDVEAIIHLAAAVPHSPQYPDTEATADLTRTMDRSVLRFAQASRCAVVYASSCGLYDRSSAAVKRECESSVHAHTPYFAAKIDGERMFLSGAVSVVARLSAPVGPLPKPGLVVSRFLAAALNGEAIEIWGSGLREQDFIDVRDAARLLVLAATQPTPATMNVAAGRPTTMRELAETVVQVVGRGTIRSSGRPDPHEGETARYAIEYAHSVYGWAPAYSLAQALVTAVAE